MGYVIPAPTSGDYESIPTGLQPAVCSLYFDIGKQPDTQGNLRDKVVILWELEARKKNGDHFYITKTYSASLHEKANLRKDLEAWRGKAFDDDDLVSFDLDNIVGRLCILSIMEQKNQTGKKSFRIMSVNPPGKNTDYIEPELARTFVPKWIADIKAGVRTAAPEEEMIF